MSNNDPFYGELPPVPQKKYSVEGVGDRLDMYRRSLGLKGGPFAKLLKLSQGSYSDIKNGKSLPSAKTIINLYAVEENLLTIKWILTGKKS